MSVDIDRNKAIVRRLYAGVWDRGDLSVAAAIMAEPKPLQRYLPGKIEKG